MPWINYEIFLSKLDARVCPICRKFHGQIFKQGEGPRPRISTHPGCRCRRVHHSTVFAPHIEPTPEQPDPEELVE